MKYNTISTSSLTSEGRKSTLRIYADMDISPNKMAYTESEVSSIRGELEIVQKALKLQTKRCRQLVTEYTRRLQEKEQQYRSEKALRDDQLAKVLKALLIFEARLRQEQKYISHQLNEKDYTIKKQSNDIKKLLTNQYCKSCKQYYVSSPIQESLDSSTEYVATDYQSSNFESLDSSSDIYATVAEKGEDKFVVPDDDIPKPETESIKNIYQKNRNKDSIGRRSRKIAHRKSIGTYFEVLKLRNDSPISNEDNTSNDYDNLDSLPPETITDKINLVSENIEDMLDQNREFEINESTDSSLNISLSECNNTVINSAEEVAHEELVQGSTQNKASKITESIPLFEADGETNNSWYASDQDDHEDEGHGEVYKNNPVLECMNQILLQNINDPLNSPPKTPSIERKSVKSKRVKFSDEEERIEDKEESLIKVNVEEKQHNTGLNYYETPIQKPPNFYETPQSIYSNDYEQILSKCSETFSSPVPSESNPVKDVNLFTMDHYYVDMENKIENLDSKTMVRKSKISRTPPALPPKPANLVSKYKMQDIPKEPPTKMVNENVVEVEPDYCSISELNLPQSKSVSFKKVISVVAEINAPTSLDVINKLNCNEKSKSKLDLSPNSDLVKLNDDMVVKKCVEKFNIQLAKQTPIKSESAVVNSNTKKNEPEIPKLPQVSEILIPDDTEEKEKEKDKEERITQDNYVKNNSQILMMSTKRKESRRPIVIGSSVSSIISGFNNQQLLNEIKHKPERSKLNKTVFSSFENLQNIDKHVASEDEPATPNFEKFDLSQNFEEFKLDDCEIEEYTVESESDTNTESNDTTPKPHASTQVELIRAKNDVTPPALNRHSVELLKKHLKLDPEVEQKPVRSNEPTYEHFLECTGLSSKSLLTPSRMMSNHKSMLKPKDVKLRSKVKANNLFERNSTSTIRYWSEPYI